jgi:hypothetical protein
VFEQQQLVVSDALGASSCHGALDLQRLQVVDGAEAPDLQGIGRQPC